MALRTLREIRKQLKLSQEALADEIGISVSQVSRVERGERKLRFDTAKRWAARLRIRIDDIPSDNLALAAIPGDISIVSEIQLIEEALRAAAALGQRQWEEHEFSLAAELIQAFSLKWRSSAEDLDIRRMKLELEIRRAFQRGSR